MTHSPFNVRHVIACVNRRKKTPPRHCGHFTAARCTQLSLPPRIELTGHASDQLVASTPSPMEGCYPNKVRIRMARYRTDARRSTVRNTAAAGTLPRRLHPRRRPERRLPYGLRGVCELTINNNLFKSSSKRVSPAPTTSLHRVANSFASSLFLAIVHLCLSPSRPNVRRHAGKLVSKRLRLFTNQKPLGNCGQTRATAQIPHIEAGENGRRVVLSQ